MTRFRQFAIAATVVLVIKLVLPGLAAGQSAARPGDLNGDGRVNILDIQLAVNVFLGTQTNPTIKALADVDGDGIVAAADIQIIVNIALNIAAESVTQIVTASAGGTITLPSGSSVSIPAGLFAVDQTITLSRRFAYFQEPPSVAFSRTSAQFSLSLLHRFRHPPARSSPSAFRPSLLTQGPSNFE
jgi:hypothetical protein